MSGETQSAVIQIGNSDDKLTQKEWSDFVAAVRNVIGLLGTAIHFAAGAENSCPWQNYCFVIEIEAGAEAQLREQLAHVAGEYRQESIAVLLGKTEFVRAV